MELKGKFKVLKIKKKTSAVFFKELKEGDEFGLGYNLNGGHGHASWIDIYKDEQEVHSNNALQLSGNLANFELEQVS